MTWLLWVGSALCLVVVAGVALSAYGAKRWSAMTQAQTAQLEASRVVAAEKPGNPIRYYSRDLEGLPAPVQRYFRTVLTEGQPMIDAASVDLAGTFNMAPNGERWKPFTARQRVVTARPGFLWDEKISMLPDLDVRVVDSYIAGEGVLHAAILGIFTMANVNGGGEIARGEFMRYFAEAAWYPTALLPSQGVRWEAVDDSSANATIADGPLTLTLLFRFNEAGLIGSFRAEARGSSGTGKDMLMLPWESIWSKYQVRDGMTVPFTGEIAWMRPEGCKPYFVGSVVSLTYDFAA